MLMGQIREKKKGRVNSNHPASQVQLNCQWLWSNITQSASQLVWIAQCLNEHFCWLCGHCIRAAACCCLVSKLCLTLCNPMDCRLPDSSVHGIFQAKLLEWVANSRGLPDPGIESPVSPALQADSSPLSHQGSPLSKSSSFALGD